MFFKQTKLGSVSSKNLAHLSLVLQLSNAKNPEANSQLELLLP
jgi:hypothetical protein